MTNPDNNPYIPTVHIAVIFVINMTNNNKIDVATNVMDTDQQAIDEQQRIHEEQLIEDEYTADDKQLTKIKEIEEYKSGKILYEEVLTGMLQQCNTAYQRNKHTTFCRTVQSIWNNCYRADREEIYQEVKKTAKQERDIHITRALKKEMMTIKDSKLKERWKKGIAELEKKCGTRTDRSPYPKERILDVKTFDTLMRSNLSNIMEKGFLLHQNWYGTEWRLSYQIIQETLRKKYHGTVKQFVKDTLEG